MLTAAKWALAIVPGGIMLGAVLGGAANPDMKDAPAPWWRLTGAEPFASCEPAPEEWPEDLAAARSYRPDLDYDAEVWALPIPADEAWAVAEEPVAPDSGVAEDAAAKAQAAAGDALAVPEPPAAPEVTPETPAPVPPQLTGLY